MYVCVPWGSPEVGMRHLEDPKNPDEINLDIHIFVYVEKLNMCIYIFCFVF